jgi:hypothetical protein
MNRKQSILLDILLNDFTIPKYRGNLGMVDIKKVINSNKELKKLNDSEINRLLYIIRKEQIKIGINLLSGDAIFLVYESHIKDFLNNGGFKKIYRKHITDLLIKRTLQIGGFLALIRLLFLGFEYIYLPDKKQDDKLIIQQSEILQAKTLKDSSNIHYHKTKITDSLKVQ